MWQIVTSPDFANAACVAMKRIAVSHAFDRRIAHPSAFKEGVREATPAVDRMSM